MSEPGWADKVDSVRGVVQVGKQSQEAVKGAMLQRKEKQVRPSYGQHQPHLARHFCACLTSELGSWKNGVTLPKEESFPVLA